MTYKHWNIGKHAFGNIYFNMPTKQKFKFAVTKVNILRYNMISHAYSHLYVFEFKYKSFGFDIGIKLK